MAGCKRDGLLNVRTEQAAASSSGGEGAEVCCGQWTLVRAWALLVDFPGHGLEGGRLQEIDDAGTDVEAPFLSDALGRSVGNPKTVVSSRAGGLV